eukprot:g17826.t1
MPNQRTATKKSTAASATNFVKVVRALLRSPSRNAAAAAVSTAVAVPRPASEVEEDSDEAATDQIPKNREVRRTALDVSGHHFGKNLREEIRRARNQRQQLGRVSEPDAGDSDAKSLPDTAMTVIQRRQQPSVFFDVVPGEDHGLFSSSRTLLREGVGRGGHADGDKSSPRSSRASSATSTLPPSPDAACTAAAARPRSELPPPVPKPATSRCTAGSCRRRQQQQQQQQSSRAAFFA